VNGGVCVVTQVLRLLRVHGLQPQRLVLSAPLSDAAALRLMVALRLPVRLAGA
jgi:hypothetical protein